MGEGDPGLCAQDSRGGGSDGDVFGGTAPPLGQESRIGSLLGAKPLLRRRGEGLVLVVDQGAAIGHGDAGQGCIDQRWVETGHPVGVAGEDLEEGDPGVDQGRDVPDGLRPDVCRQTEVDVGSTLQVGALLHQVVDRPHWSGVSVLDDGGHTPSGGSQGPGGKVLTLHRAGSMRWTWVSTIPGSTNKPAASTMSPDGSRSPTPTTRPSSIRRWPGRDPVDETKVRP